MRKDRHFKVGGVLVLIVVLISIGFWYGHRSPLDYLRPASEPISANAMIGSTDVRGEAAQSMTTRADTKSATHSASLALPGKRLNATNQLADWRLVRASDDLLSVIGKLESTENMEERAIIFRLNSICSVVPGDTQSLDTRLGQVAQSKRELKSLRESDLVLARSAGQSLQRFCTDFGSEALAARISGLLSKARLEQSLAKASIGLPQITGQSQLTTDQVVAITAALASPLDNAFAVDTILRRLMPLDSGIDFTSHRAAMDIVYGELTGDRSPESLRALLACYSELVCQGRGENSTLASRFPSATSNDEERVRSYANQVLDLVARRSWNELKIRAWSPN